MKAQKKDTGATKKRTGRPDRSSEAKKINKLVSGQPPKMSSATASTDQAPKMSSAIRERLKTRTKEYDKTYKHLKKKEPIAKAKAKPKPKAQPTTQASSSSSGPGRKLGVTHRSSSAVPTPGLHTGPKPSGASSSSGGTLGIPGALKKTMQKMQSGQL